jgi:hypothetical protein
MSYGDMNQQTTQQNPQAWGGFNPQQFGQSPGQQYGGGQGTFGQQPGQAAYGGQMFGQPNIGGFGQNWSQQRQLSQQDVGEIVRQLVPLLPQVLAQTQQSPMLAYGGFGQPGQFGQTQRMLTQQDVNEVVRQILPIVPQIVALLQGQTPWQGAAAYGGWNQSGQGFGQGQQNPYGTQGYGQQFPQHGQHQQNFQQQPFGQFGTGQFGTPQVLAAFGSQGFGGQGFGGHAQHRQLSHHDINDILHQLVGVIPQVMANLQGSNQQRMFN